MGLTRACLHRIYTTLTRGQRAAARREFDAESRWPAAILFYHRIAHSPKNPWTIDRSVFESHLDLVAELGGWASIREIQQDQIMGRRERPKFGLSFDDGYYGNLDHAIPEILRRRIPATYFVTTSNVEFQEPFPHDLQRGQPLRPNTKKQIRELAEAGLDIGGHTATHPDLGKNWTRAELVREISDSRKKLQDWTGQAIDYFAFPYGGVANMSTAAIEVVVKSGYRGFVSAFGGWNFPDQDQFHLVRFHGDPCTAAVRNWLTLDPRKLNQHQEFHYRKAELASPTEHAAPLASIAPSFALPSSFNNSQIETHRA
jgi:peptidoglycan/xylan/chitin deacetylase (PgdA/CDA1 family)